MAKKKHVAKRHYKHHRRGRVGAITSGLTEVLTGVAGAVAGRVVYNMATKVNATTGKAPLSTKAAAGIVLVAGVGIRKFVKNPMAQGLGLGMSAYGGLQLAQSMGVLNGLPSSNMVAGYLSAGASGGKNLVAGAMQPDNTMPGLGMVGALVDEC